MSPFFGFANNSGGDGLSGAPWVMGFANNVGGDTLSGLSDSTTGTGDYTASWYDIVGTMRQLGPALDAAESNLLNTLDAAMQADFNADPDGNSTPNTDHVTDLLSQIQDAISTFNSIAGALNTLSGVFPGGPIGLASLGGILPDSVGGWTLASILTFFNPLASLISAAMAVYTLIQQANAPGSNLTQAVSQSITQTSTAVNQAIENLGNAPGQIGSAIGAGLGTAGKWVVIGVVAFLLLDQLGHKHGIL